MIFLVVTSNDLCSRKKKPKKQKPEQDALEPAILKTKFKWRWTGGSFDFAFWPWSRKWDSRRSRELFTAGRRMRGRNYWRPPAGDTNDLSGILASWYLSI